MGRHDQHDNVRGVGRRTVLGVSALTGVAALGRPAAARGTRDMREGRYLLPATFCTLAAPACARQSSRSPSGTQFPR